MSSPSSLVSRERVDEAPCARGAGSRATRPRSGGCPRPGRRRACRWCRPRSRRPRARPGTASTGACLSSSTRRAPRASCDLEAASRSEPKAANASSSRYWARSRRRRPATLRIALTCAEPPTRETETPTLIAGRTPELNRSVSRKHWPSVIEMTLVGMNAETSLPLVSMIGRPVIEPPPSSSRELRAALEQPRVQVEDVTGVGLATRRAAQQQRDRAVGVGLLGQVVEHDQDVLALVHPVLADGRAGVRREVLEAGRVRRGGGDDRRVLQRAVLLERLAHGGDRRALLADGDVDALDLALGVAGLPVGLLVDDRVEATAVLPVCRSPMISWRWPRPIGGHRVDRLDAGLQRLLDRLALDHRGRLQLEGAALGRTRSRPCRRAGCPAGRRPGRGSRRRPAPTGPRPVRLTGWPSSMPRNSPSTTAPISRTSRFSARPSVPSSNSSSSLVMAEGRPSMCAMPSPASVTCPTSSRPAVSGSYDETKRSSASRISSGRMVSSAMVAAPALVSSVVRVVTWVCGVHASRRAVGGRRRGGRRPSRRSTSSPISTRMPPTRAGSSWTLRCTSCP